MLSTPPAAVSAIWLGATLAEEYAKTNDKTEITRWHFEPGTFNPLAKETISADGKNSFYPIVTDHLGTPKELFDTDGNCVWQAEHGLWGETEVSFAKKADNYQPLVDCNLRFQNQWEDEETGLYYNLNRYYDPDSGQYLSIDPIALEGGLRTHGYVHDPMHWIDPLGLTADPAKATHITYEGIKNGKPYVGYASKPGLGHSAQDVLKYRYPNTDHFDVPPKHIYVGDGIKGKQVARGLEQRVFEDRGGLKGTSNLQNPVGPNNDNRKTYLEAADKYRAEKTAKRSTTKC